MSQKEQTKKKYIILSFAVLILAAWFVFGGEETAEKSSAAAEQAENTGQISAEELRMFLKTWIDYCQQEDHCPQIPELSYDTADAQSRLDTNLAVWLRQRGWNLNRFVYVESRLRVIIATIWRDREILKRQQLMREGAQNVDNAQMAETVRQASERQNQALNIEKISPAERQMVEPQLEAIVKLLDGQY